jgi:hypothetical protein
MISQRRLQFLAGSCPTSLPQGLDNSIRLQRFDVGNATPVLSVEEQQREFTDTF